MPLILPDMDFETYSEAGYDYSPKLRKWVPQMANKRNGLEIVGAPAYSEHPSTELLSLAYDLKDGLGPRLWEPRLAPPQELFTYLATGGPIEAWNSIFEYFIWKNVCQARMGWPELPLGQLRDAMAKARAWALPAALEKAAKASGAQVLKIEDGKRLLTKFSKPRNPTKTDPRLRIRVEDDPVDAQLLYQYNIGDIEAEASISALVPDLNDAELKVWLIDQQINARGVGVDTVSVENCQAIIDQALVRAVGELQTLTGGVVEGPTKLMPMKKWLASRGTHVGSLDKEALAGLLANPLLPPDVRRVLEIRSELGAASVKKLAAIYRSVSVDGRLRDLYGYCGASRTGRWAGYGAQPQNLPNSGPSVHVCPCGRHYGTHRSACPWCGRHVSFAPVVEWNIDAVRDALDVARARDLVCFEYFFDDAVEIISSCLRGLFQAGPGNEIICSDYSAIEAVVLACLAGEQWRIDVFNTHGKIYEMSAAKITGITFEQFIEHKKATGEHHPMRKKVGKVAELASGYGGGVGAWKRFGADKHFDNDEQIQTAITAWREDSPMVVALWSGLEDAAKMAIRCPNQWFEYRDLAYAVHGDVLYCRLPSGRTLSYHNPRLAATTTPWGAPSEEITYMGWDSVVQQWIRTKTYGGKLVENACQAVARDIFAQGMVNLTERGYDIVLHTHDEPAAEVPIGFGSIEEFEELMCKLPAWCQGWPIRAAGGWRGRRYRKD